LFWTIICEKNSAAFAFKPLFSRLTSPTDNIQTFASPASLFLVIFHTKKKFYETRFIKLSSMPLSIVDIMNFTNYFSVLSQKYKSPEFSGLFLR
jgi:hypothetical protein